MSQEKVDCYKKEKANRPAARRANQTKKKKIIEEVQLKFKENKLKFILNIAE